MAKTLLVPLDGKAASEHTIEVVEEFCATSDRLILLAIARPASAVRSGSMPGMSASAMVTPSANVAPVVTPDVSVFAETKDQSIQGSLDEARDYLEKLASPLRRKGFSVSTEVHISENPGEAIIEYARQTHPTLIAMLGNPPSLGDRVFGSVTSNVVKAGIAPVLIVPVKG